MTVLGFRIPAFACGLLSLALAAGTLCRLGTSPELAYRQGTWHRSENATTVLQHFHLANQRCRSAAAEYHDPRDWVANQDGSASAYALAFSPLGDSIAVVGSEGAVIVLDAGTGKRLLTIPQRPSASPQATACCGVAYSPDGQWVAAASGGDSVQMWSSRTGEKGRRFKAPWPAPAETPPDLYSPAAIAFSPDGRIFAARLDKGSDDVVELYEVGTGKPLRCLPLRKESHSGMPDTGGYSAFAPGGVLLAVSYHSKLITLWDVDTGKKARDFVGHCGTVSGVSFSPDGRLLASCAGYWGDRSTSGLTVPEATIKLWDTATGRCLLTTPEQSDNVRSVVFTSDGQAFASGGEDQKIRLWEAATGQELFHWDVGQTVNQVAVSPDGKSLAAALDNGSVRLVFMNPLSSDALPPIKGDAFDRLWGDLGGKEAKAAYRAVNELSRGTGNVDASIAQRLHAVPRVGGPELRRLIADLNADDFDRREAASKALAALGPQAESALRKALDETTSAEVRSRIKPLLKALDQWVVTDPDQLRALRAIWVLERIGTPEARAVLEDLAQGAPEARQTLEAKNALDFLDKRAAAARPGKDKDK